MRQINTAALNLIKGFESLRLEPYICPAGVPTIGYGTTIYPDGKKVSMKDPHITQEEAEKFLLHDVEEFAQAIDKAVTSQINDNQFGALVSLAYNIGINAFLKSTILRKLNLGDYSGAAEELLRWVYGGGRILPGLVKRRQAERSLFLHPS